MPFSDKPFAELVGRSNRFRSQRFLPVAYYRIRKHLAVPLPITVAVTDSPKVRDFSSPYPWGIWLKWALEERVLCLGEVVTSTGNAAAKAAVEADLLALAAWPIFRESPKPDLAFAHAVRLLCRALDGWSWLDLEKQAVLRTALWRAVDDALGFSDQLHGAFTDAASLLNAPRPHQHLHNIPLIGTCALATAAALVQHPAAARLQARVETLFVAVLALRAKGFTEGASYDGYVLDFIADWLTVVDSATRQRVLDHPAFAGLLEQVVVLSVPGDVLATAPLGDVEPVEMPFVWSALAKLQVWRSNPAVAWAFMQCDLSRLRADALAALARWDAKAFEVAVAPSVLQPAVTNYALVLRTGFTRDDVAVAMGLSHSPMGHIQCDNGSLVLGTRGRWWLDDPGYQQYLQTSERQFTVGVTAHNAPVIQGHAQVRKQPSLLAATRLVDAPDVQFALLDLTACYPAEAQAGRVRRAVWLIGSEHVVVCDDLALGGGQSIAYHWHGHADLFWGFQAGGATLVSAEDADRWLHVFSPQISLGAADLHRLRGSRGQQTLAVTLYPPGETCVWWVFSFAAERPSFSAAGRQLHIGDRTLRLDDRLPEQAATWQALSRETPLLVSATQQGGSVIGRCVASPAYFQGELEYAFYLMIDGEKALVAWYTPNPEVCFTLPDGAEGKALEVRGFVREKANPEKKLMRGAVVPKVPGS